MFDRRVIKVMQAVGVFSKGMMTDQSRLERSAYRMGQCNVFTLHSRTVRILKGLKIGWSLRLRNVIVENDSTTRIVQLLNNRNKTEHHNH